MTVQHQCEHGLSPSSRRRPSTKSLRFLLIFRRAFFSFRSYQSISSPDNMSSGSPSILTAMSQRWSDRNSQVSYGLSSRHSHLAFCSASVFGLWRTSQRQAKLLFRDFVLHISVFLHSHSLCASEHCWWLLPHAPTVGIHFSTTQRPIFWRRVLASQNR